MGRVEVFRYNEWGTICDDRFSSFDERVVCGLLNYTRGGVCSAKGAAFETGEGIMIHAYIPVGTSYNFLS